MQNITITGYLSRDAETSQTQSGQTVTRWNVPVKQGWGEREQTNWYRVSIWGKRADHAGKARKGEYVVVSGELTIGEYQGKPQYEINAADFQSVRTAPRPDGGASDPSNMHGGGGWRGKSPADDEDSIPFARNDTVW